MERKADMSPNDILRRAGEALYGESWVAPLSDALDINPRTIQRWASGKNEINPAIWQEILDLIGGRALAALAVAADIYKLKSGATHG
jgi:hypothetical protein